MHKQFPIIEFQASVICLNSINFLPCCLSCSILWAFFHMSLKLLDESVTSLSVGDAPRPPHCPPLTSHS